MNRSSADKVNFCILQELGSKTEGQRKVCCHLHKHVLSEERDKHPLLNCKESIVWQEESVADRHQSKHCGTCQQSWCHCRPPLHNLEHRTHRGNRWCLVLVLEKQTKEESDKLGHLVLCHTSETLQKSRTVGDSLWYWHTSVDTFDSPCTTVVANHYSPVARQHGRCMTMLDCRCPVV